MYTYHKKLITLAVVLCSAIVAQAQTKQALIDSVITRCNKLQLFNGNVLIIDGGKEVYRKVIGYADASKKTMLTDEYRFHIGSIAKEFNATAIMMLQQRGKLKVDDKVITYVKELPACAKNVTILNLLKYASGLPNLKFNSIKNEIEAMDSVKAITKLDFEPGTNYAYNNTNTFLQRKVIENITGMSFNRFVEQEMLKPLKMESSLVDPEENTPLMAKSYDNKFVQAPLQAPIPGWTAVTLDDFYRWEQCLEQFKLINAASTLQIMTPFAPGKQCGLGGGSMQNNHILLHTHDGTAQNYQALLTANTALKRTVILLTNNKQNNLYDINGAIQNILDGKPYTQPKRQLITKLQDVMDGASGAELLVAYSELKMKHADEYNLDNEDALNNVGYALLNKKRYADAIVIFEYNAKLFPASGNVFDSLAEAHDRKGDAQAAILNYKKSLALNPQNSGAKQRIAELTK